MLLLAIVLACGGPARAAPVRENGDVGIRIERCAVEERTYLEDPFNGQRVNLVTGVSVRLVNGGSAGITRIGLRLRYAGSTESFAENGSYAAGSVIDRRFAAFSGEWYAGAAADCAVTDIEYADGTTWKPGS